MKNISHVELKADTKEELLHDLSPEFPCITSCVEIDTHAGRMVPWHWHRAVELFYIESGGAMEYCTPSGRFVFPAGSGGFVNSNVLHMTKPFEDQWENKQFLHLFEPGFISGQSGSRIEQKFVLPLTAASQLEIIPLYPENHDHTGILQLIRESFQLSEKDPGYEVKLRSMLSEIWLCLLNITKPLLGTDSSNKSCDQIKQMMVYIHEHYSEKITIHDLSQAAFLSERACFRLFRDVLHMTPVEYIKSFRLQMACQLLATTSGSVTDIAAHCGLGGSSYFSKVFRDEFGFTPLEYRKKAYRKHWQDNDKTVQD